MFLKSNGTTKKMGSNTVCVCVFVSLCQCAKFKCVCLCVLRIKQQNQTRQSIVTATLTRSRVFLHVVPSKWEYSLCVAFWYSLYSLGDELYVANAFEGEIMFVRVCIEWDEQKMSFSGFFNTKRDSSWTYPNTIKSKSWNSSMSCAFPAYDLFVSPSKWQTESMSCACTNTW